MAPLFPLLLLFCTHVGRIIDGAARPSTLQQRQSTLGTQFTHDTRKEAQSGTCYRYFLVFLLASSPSCSMLFSYFLSQSEMVLCMRPRLLVVIGEITSKSLLGYSSYPSGM